MEVRIGTYFSPFFSRSDYVSQGMWVELHEPAVAYFPTAVPISVLLFLLSRHPRFKPEMRQSIPFLLSSYFMVPEVHHDQQQEQRKKYYYLNSLVQADLWEQLEELYEFEHDRFQKGWKARETHELLTISGFVLFWFFLIIGL